MRYFLIFLSLVALLFLFLSPMQGSAVASSFISSVDTMKLSRDTSTRPISQAEMNNAVSLSASVNAKYITVDTFWDYPAYMQQWVNTIHSVGKSVFFRGHPNQWEDNNGTTGIMTPSAYLSYEHDFIVNHPTLFHSGDIFDACSEPEQGKYWLATYGSGWSYNPPAPNTATRDFNSFIRNGSDVADQSFAQIGVSGVITSVRSTNSYFAGTANELEPATVSKFGRVTVDSYPEGTTTDPATAAQAHVNELQKIENLWHVPIMIGELGYSNKVNVDDATQEAVLSAELNAISQLSYVSGMNYWVGPGCSTCGGYTNIFVKINGIWVMRPAATELANYFLSKD